MGLKDHKLFPVESISVAKDKGRTNTRQNCSRVDADLKENWGFFVFFKVCEPLAQATRRDQSMELRFFTKPKIRLQINQSSALHGLGRPEAIVQPGMSSTNSTSSSSTWTEKHHRELQENQDIYHDQHNEAWWATYSGSEAAGIAEYCATCSAATSSNDDGPEASPVKWYDHAPNEFQQLIDFYEAQQQGQEEFDMWDSSSEGSCCLTTTSRRNDCRPLTAKELVIFDKEMVKFFKTYNSPIGSESGYPCLIIYVYLFQALPHFLLVLPESE